MSYYGGFKWIVLIVWGLESRFYFNHVKTISFFTVLNSLFLKWFLCFVWANNEALITFFLILKAEAPNDLIILRKCKPSYGV